MAFLLHQLLIVCLFQLFNPLVIVKGDFVEHFISDYFIGWLFIRHFNCFSDLFHCWLNSSASLNWQEGKTFITVTLLPIFFVKLFYSLLTLLYSPPLCNVPSHSFCMKSCTDMIDLEHLFHSWDEMSSFYKISSFQISS